MREIIREKISAYRKAGAHRKTEIISSIVEVTGMHRKAVLRAMARELRRRKQSLPETRGRPKLFTADTEAALAFVWEQYDYPSAERLVLEIPEAIRVFRRDGMWDYCETTTNQLLGMSLGSMKIRCVAMAKKRGLMRGLSTTKSGELLRSVPVFFGAWSTKPVGYGQVDTVVHSGPKLMGSMVYTVNFTDVATYWQEPIAQLNKGEKATYDSLEAIKGRLPFPMTGLHPDSGSEFINLVGIQWCDENKIDLSRSRPYMKNDNRFVEQRNRVVVRKYVGYERYDCKEAVDVMNELYEVVRLYINFFQPTYKLIRKEKRVLASGENAGKQYGKPYKRIYDTIRTPYQRVLDQEEEHISAEIKAKLTAQYETLNPKVLRDTIKTLTTKLHKTQVAQGYSI
jgi:hypothetical protein